MKQCFLDAGRDCEESCMAFVGQKDKPICLLLSSARVASSAAINLAKEGLRIRELKKKKEETHHPTSAPPPEVKI